MTTEQDEEATEQVADESHDLDALIEAYVAARIAREAASVKENDLRSIEARAEMFLFEAMERHNLRGVRHRTLGQFLLNDIADATVTSNELVRAWALREHPEVLLPNYQRLGKVVRDALKEGDALPDGVEAVFRRKIAWRDRPQ
jgi:hypothetical protein